MEEKPTIFTQGVARASKGEMKKGDLGWRV